MNEVKTEKSIVLFESILITFFSFIDFINRSSVTKKDGRHVRKLHRFR